MVSVSGERWHRTELDSGSEDLIVRRIVHPLIQSTSHPFEFPTISMTFGAEMDLQFSLENPLLRRITFMFLVRKRPLNMSGRESVLVGAARDVHHSKDSR